MKPKGTIYQKGRSLNYGNTPISLPSTVRFVYGLLRAAGAGFVAFMFLGLFYTYGPIIGEEFKYKFKYHSQAATTADNISGVGAEEVDDVRREAHSMGVDANFSIVIPKIDAKSNIIANVEAGNWNEYQEALKKGVAHAKGTYFPGQQNLIYLFSHSTNSDLNMERYNAVFYLLRKLEVGDRVVIFFADKKYIYEVKEKIVTSAEDISWLNRNQGEELVLQTCDPPGTSFRRLLILAKPVRE